MTLCFNCSTNLGSCGPPALNNVFLVASMSTISSTCADGFPDPGGHPLYQHLSYKRLCSGTEIHLISRHTKLRPHFLWVINLLQVVQIKLAAQTLISPRRCNPSITVTLLVHLMSLGHGLSLDEIVRVVRVHQ